MAETLAKICPKCSSRFDVGATFCQKDGAILRLLEEERDPRIGQTLLDQFRIEEKIGAGGMGAVYRARQVTVGRDVAIKILHPDLASNADAVRRFQREARISVALDHPNVVRVFLFGQLPDGSLYLVMELLRGRPLADLLRVEPRLPLQRVVYILSQIADGVGEAHEQGIVHRDVKPENVFLVSKGRDPDYAKVLDFGIARILRPEEQTVMTQSGLVFGTARYISPEGAAGEPTDARSDVYSLGVLAYQMLCGETPFDAPAPVTLLMKHIHEPASPLRNRAGGSQVPVGIADVVMRSLSKNPDGRYQDANEFGEVLRDAAQRAGINAGRPRTGSFGLASSPGTDSASREPSQRVETAAPPAAREPEPERPARASSRRKEPEPASTTEELSIAGLRSPRRERSRSDGGRPISTVIMAFVIGALAVVGAVFAVRALTGPSADSEHAAAVARAEAALAAHRWDGSDGVDVLTSAMLTATPEDADARRIRQSAADILVAEGHEAETGDHPGQARARFERALSFVEDHQGARDALTALDAPAAPQRAEAIVISPTPVAGEPVIITATIAGGRSLTDADRPHFVLMRDGRRVGRGVESAPTGIEGTYSATYTFATAGAYTVEFHAGDGAAAYTFRTDVDVARGTRPRPVGGGDPPVTTQGSLGPMPISPVPSVIDAPILRPVVPALPSAFTTSTPPTSTGTPPPIQPLSRPSTTTTTTTTTSDPPALPPAWTSGN